MLLSPICRFPAILLALVCHGLADPAAPSCTVTLISPLNYEVLQRRSLTSGRIPLRAAVTGTAGQWQYQLTHATAEGNPGLPAGAAPMVPLDESWHPLPGPDGDGLLQASIPAPAGGWYHLEIRGVTNNQTLATASIGQVGIGEVFIIAGQSNAANYGSEKQVVRSGKVTSWSGQQWALAHDPQPGASGGSGSFMPAFGDALQAKLGVPIGLVAIAEGATSVREWLPQGRLMKQQPTTGGNVVPAGAGEWASTGQLFERFTQAFSYLGPHGFRAILWHQGESDAGQARAGYPADRQITGTQYVGFMRDLIQATRTQAGWPIPWFTAQTTYHQEQDPPDPEFRAAMQQLWDEGLSLQGPDTDALRANYRDGVHFNAAGLVKHGEWWSDLTANAILSQRLVLPPTGAGTVPPWEKGSRMSADPHKITLLPGQSGFVFSMYGAPGDIGPLKELVATMREQKLGNGFDPAPGPGPASKPIFDYLASIGWPAVCYSGSEMQIDGGRAVFGAEHAAALSAMDQAGVFNALQLGEWGYHFHRLRPAGSWWRDVYGKEFDQFKHLMQPAGLAGYATMPANRQECYDAVQAYFTHRSRDLLNRVCSVTGHSHYEAYAGGWGATCIGLEVGENIAFTQSKFAFARGASRQWQKPWTVQVSPWFHGACTTSGPLRMEGQNARGLDAGHSLSFYQRMWLHGWFAGAAMVTPENSVATFFEKPEAPWTLTSHGQKAAEIFPFMQAHERGVPWMPVAIVIDHLAGYNGYMDKPWGILEPTAGDRQLRDLFDSQLYPDSDHIHRQPFPDNPELSYLRPTPYGEIFDVQLTSASETTLLKYPVLLLAGDITFDPVLIAKLEQALRQGRTVLLSPVHQAALGPQLARLAALPGLEVLQPWTDPGTQRPAAIPHSRLTQLVQETTPIEVSGDPVAWQINRSATSWIIGCINPQGVFKKPDQPAVVDPAAIAHLTLRPKFPCRSASEWRSNRPFPDPATIHLEIPPGETVFVEFRDSP